MEEMQRADRCHTHAQDGMQIYDNATGVKAQQTFSTITANADEGIYVPHLIIVSRLSKDEQLSSRSASVRIFLRWQFPRLSFAVYFVGRSLFAYNT